jgi:hypothetical protein
MIFGEELRIGGLVTVLGSAAFQFREEEDFVGVKGVMGMALQVAVEKSGELGDAHIEAGLFADFAHGSDRRRFANIGPAAGEGPAAVFEFANEKDAVVAESGDARSRIAGRRGCGWERRRGAQRRRPSCRRRWSGVPRSAECRIYLCNR